MIGWAILIQYCRGLSMAAAPFDWSSINKKKMNFCSQFKILFSN